MINIPSIHINKWLLPLSWLYGVAVYFRNKFFDCGILKQEDFDIPVICVGNLTVGGTGKTPHTEFLVKILEKKYRVGVLSRGYKRQSDGFVLATGNSTSKEIGDEPFQIKNKYPNAIVAVDGNRRRGIRKMLALETPPEVILLDDAFQHRYVKPSYTIILSDYNRPVYEDVLLPAGRLREPASRLQKADTIIVTKCSGNIQPIDFRIISHNINAYPYQGLFFTTLAYQGLKRVFGDQSREYPLENLANKDVLLVTGIASPKTLLKKLSEYTDKVEAINYPDHHNFKEKDIKHISDTFHNMRSERKIILVTEKDASRLVSLTEISEDIKNNLYYLPIEIEFIDSKEEDFKEKIYKHVRENTRNRSIRKE